MSNLQLLHYWLMNTWLGLLATGVIACIIFAGGVKISRLLVRIVIVLPSGIRLLSSEAAYQRIKRLQRVHNNTYHLVLEITYQIINTLALFLLNVLFGFVAIFVAIRLREPFSTVHSRIERQLLFLEISDFVVIVVVLSFVMSILALGYLLLRLYLDLNDYDGTMQSLQTRIAESDRWRIES